MRLPSRNAWCAVIVVLTLLPALAALPLAVVPATIAVVAIAAALLHWPYRSISLRVAALVATVASLVTDVAFPGPQNLVLLWLPVELCALCGLLGRVIRVLPARDAAFVGALTTSAIVLLPLRLVLWSSAVDRPVAVVVAFSLTFLFPAGFAAGVGLYLRSLDNRRRVAVSMARRNQRLQLAHNLHDFIAHEVTGIVVEAQAAQVGADGTERTQAVLQRIESAGLRALDSMDNTLRMLRETEEGDSGTTETVRLYGLRDLPELVERFAHGHGPPNTRLQMPEDPPVLGREANHLGYALVLEALTNVRRHAPDSTHVTIAVTELWDGTVELTVVNEGGAGSLAGSSRSNGGTGLIGLGERMKVLGGTLTAGPAESGEVGWLVRGVLPARG